MKIKHLFLCSALLISQQAVSESVSKPIAIAIHGGAGTIERSKMSAEQEAAYHAKLAEALKVGHAVLKAGGSAVEAVEQSIRIMEDSPLFNAGKGAVFTHDERNELDASIMNGADLNAGAVAGVSRIRNPISAAKAVMLQSPHVMLSGKGAEAFAASQQLTMVEPAYFHTERRWQQLQRLKSPQKAQPAQASRNTWPDDHKFGTVGAVALDKDGNLAAGTSTGGMTNKRWGRIGDSPVIGAGTYADNQSCAISATGHGEYFIRAAVAHDICARSLYQEIPLQQAADAVIQEKLVAMQGDGGIVGLSPKGDIVFPLTRRACIAAPSIAMAS
jgi:beta-aspartyl-peptidase (threonine type)